MLPVRSTRILLAATAALFAVPAQAADAVRLVNGTEVVLETEHPYAAKENGIFRKYGLDVTVIQGPGDEASLKEVIEGRQDVINGVSTLAVLQAYAKGAPIRILGSNIRGVGDIYWYVKTSSRFKTLEDLNGGSALAYSRDGATTHLAALFLIDALKLTATPVPAGSMTNSHTRLVAGQLHTGWSVFPVNARLVREKKIRIIGTGAQATGLRGVSIRVIAANATWLKKNRAAAQRLMSALFESQMISYTSKKQRASYAKRWSLAVEDVEYVTKFTTLDAATLLPVGRLRKLNDIALHLKRIEKPLTATQLRELVHPMGNKPN